MFSGSINIKLLLHAVSTISVAYSSPTPSIVVAIKTFGLSDEYIPLVAAGKGLANLSKYSASYFSEKKGFNTIFLTNTSSHTPMTVKGEFTN